MSYEQYWDAAPCLIKAYAKAKEYEQEENNFRLWLQGVYIHEAVAIAIGNAFRDKGKRPVKYAQEPYDVYGRRAEEKRKKQEESILTKLSMFKKAWDNKVSKNGRTDNNN